MNESQRLGLQALAQPAEANPVQSHSPLSRNSLLSQSEVS